MNECPITHDDTDRRTFSEGDLYPVEEICRAIPQTPQGWGDRLLALKMDLVRAQYRGGLVVDLCCATGKHLFDLADCAERGLGIDFSPRYLEQARREAAQAGTASLDFLCADARRLPLADSSVDLLYSLSALYVIPDLPLVIAEIARVLKPGARCVLDLGIRPSLNGLCCRHLGGMARQHLVSTPDLSRMLAASGLHLVERRCFQILPMWTDQPRWLWPFVHPAWKRWLGSVVRGRMLDEWISSLPGLRRFAFRHLVVCERSRPQPHP